MTAPAAPSRRSRRRPSWRTPLVLGGAAGLAALLVFHGPKWSEVCAALTGVTWSWVVVAIGLNLASAIVRGLAWRTVVVQAIPEPHPRHLDLFSAFFVGILANGVLPGRVGEVARVGVLTRRLPPRRGLWPALLGSVAAHRLLEIVPSFALIVWVLVAAQIPRWAFAALLSVLAGGSLLFVLGLFGARRQEHGSRLEHLGPVRATVTMVRTGLGVLRTPRPALSAVLLQLAAWVLQLGAVWTAMRAFQLSVPLIAAAVVLALMNVALILPLWPGNVGLQQAAVAIPLVSYGVPYAHGFAFGIGLQAIESSVGYVLGLAFLLREGLTATGLRGKSTGAETAGGKT